MNMRTTLILAENKLEYHKFIEENHLHQRHFDYLIESSKLRGFNGTVIAVGRWWRNPSYTADFQEHLRYMHQIKNISVIKGVWGAL